MAMGYLRPWLHVLKKAGTRARAAPERRRFELCGLAGRRRARSVPESVGGLVWRARSVLRWVLRGGI